MTGLTPSSRPAGGGEATPGTLHGYQVIIDEGDIGRMSMIGVANALLRNRRLIMSLAFVAVLLGVGLLIGFRSYEAESSFSPHVTKDQGSQLAGLAAQFGVSIGGVSGGESVDFYASLLESRALLEQAATTGYRFASGDASIDTLSGDIIALYGIAGDTPEQRLARAVRVLSGDVVVRTDLDAGIITLTVSARWPGLAEAVNRRLLEFVNDFNLNKRQSQAKAERRFVDERVAAARSELDLAEDDVARFLEANRVVESPRLRAELARLQRRVDLAQQVYLTLAQALERARLDEVRNTPVITVIDQPEGSARPSGSLMMVGILSAFLGCVLGAGVAFLRDYLRRERTQNPDAYRELEDLTQAALRDLTLRPRRRAPGSMG